MIDICTLGKPNKTQGENYISIMIDETLLHTLHVQNPESKSKGQEQLTVFEIIDTRQ